MGERIPIPAPRQEKKVEPREQAHECEKRLISFVAWMQQTAAGEPDKQKSEAAKKQAAKAMDLVNELKTRGIQDSRLIELTHEAQKLLGERHQEGSATILLFPQSEDEEASKAADIE